MPYSTGAHLRAGACLHFAAVCGWWAQARRRKVKAMKSLQLHPSSNTRSAATLEPGQPVHTLVIARGCTVELTTATGCTWLTRDGVLQDWLLPAGCQLSVQGPACLRLGSAHLHTAAAVEWKTRPLHSQHRGTDPIAAGLLGQIELGVRAAEQCLRAVLAVLALRQRG